MGGKFVSYIRVSTARQGRSGLGLEAQREAVASYLNGGNWKLLAEFVEVESGKHNDRPELRKALHRCRVTGARLVIAKLDRLSRDAHFLLGLQKEGVPFVIAELPGADQLTVGMLAVLAEHERKLISQRTKDALAAYRRRCEREGTQPRLGNPNGARDLLRARKGNKAALAAIRAKAESHAAALGPVIEELRAEGITSLERTAVALNEREIRTPRGARWYASSVRNLLDRLPASAARVAR
jgi:DNA invertase Pin-like site-specific DNA recombinase